MAFLGALTALGGGLEEAEKTNIAQQKATLDQLYKQEMLQMRSLQMYNALNKQTQATGVTAETAPALEGAFGYNPEDTGIVPPAPPDQTTVPGPGAALGAPPPGMPPAGPQAGAGAPPGQPAPGQQAAQAPPQGPPQAQVAQIGNAQQPGAVQPTQPPRPDGGPTFPQPLAQQGMVQVPQMQAQPQPGRGAAYASLQQDPTQMPTPGQERARGRQGVIAQAGVPEVGRPPPQQVAQAGRPQQQPQQQQPRQQRQPRTMEEFTSYLKSFRNPQTGKPLSPKAYEEALKKGAPMIKDIETRAHQKDLIDLGRERLKFEKEKFKAGEEHKAKEEELDPEAVHLAAIEYYKTGQIKATGKHGEKLREAARKEAYETYGQVDPVANWPTNWNKYKGEGQYYRTTGMMTARVENAVNEVVEILPLAIQSSKEYYRGTIVPFNKLWNDFKRGTSDPKYNTFMAQNVALMNAYTRAMNPTGVPRVNDRLEAHAVGLLSEATSHEGYMAQVKAMWQEMQASKKATEETAKGPSKGGDVNAPLPGQQEQQEPQLSDSVIKGLEEGRPHRIKTPRGEELWQLKDGQPVKVQ